MKRLFILCSCLLPGILVGVLTPDISLSNELQESLVICKDKYDLKKSEQTFGKHTVEINNYVFDGDCGYKTPLKTHYYSTLSIISGGNKVWTHKESLDPSGQDWIGIHPFSTSPDNKLTTFIIVGNYAKKIILLFEDGNVEIINAGRFEWEEGGSYIFSVIEEDTPNGFLIYDTTKRKLIFKTDKLITSWKDISKSQYELTEKKFMLDGDPELQDKKTKYLIDLKEKVLLLKPIPN